MRIGKNRVGLILVAMAICMASGGALLIQGIMTQKSWAAGASDSANPTKYNQTVQLVGGDVTVQELKELVSEVKASTVVKNLADLPVNMIGYYGAKCYEELSNNQYCNTSSSKSLIDKLKEEANLTTSETSFSEVLAVARGDERYSLNSDWRAIVDKYGAIRTESEKKIISKAQMMNIIERAGITNISEALLYLKTKSNNVKEFAGDNVQTEWSTPIPDNSSLYGNNVKTLWGAYYSANRVANGAIAESDYTGLAEHTNEAVYLDKYATLVAASNVSLPDGHGQYKLTIKWVKGEDNSDLAPAEEVTLKTGQSYRPDTPQAVTDYCAQFYDGCLEGGTTDKASNGIDEIRTNAYWPTYKATVQFVDERGVELEASKVGSANPKHGFSTKVPTYVNTCKIIEDQPNLKLYTNGDYYLNLLGSQIKGEMTYQVKYHCESTSDPNPPVNPDPDNPSNPSQPDSPDDPSDPGVTDEDDEQNPGTNNAGGVTNISTKKPGTPDTGLENQVDQSANNVKIALGSIALIAGALGMIVTVKQYVFSPLKRK